MFFGLIILGLSGNLIATQAFGGSPSSTNYNVFVGVWVIAIALVGLAEGVFVALTGAVMTIFDGLSLFITFVGGLVR